MCIIVYNYHILIYRNRTREVIRSNGGKVPLSFDYVISVEHAPTAESNSEELGGIFKFVEGNVNQESTEDK